jgi:hypothetical protein
VTLSENPEELLRFATVIGGRYTGADRAEEFGRNAVRELLVRPPGACNRDSGRRRLLRRRLAAAGLACERHARDCAWILRSFQ